MCLKRAGDLLEPLQQQSVKWATEGTEEGFYPVYSVDVWHRYCQGYVSTLLRVWETIKQGGTAVKIIRPWLLL